MCILRYEYCEFIAVWLEPTEERKEKFKLEVIETWILRGILRIIRICYDVMHFPQRRIFVNNLLAWELDWGPYKTNIRWNVDLKDTKL